LNQNTGNIFVPIFGRPPSGARISIKLGNEMNISKRWCGSTIFYVWCGWGGMWVEKTVGKTSGTSDKGDALLDVCLIRI